jgi:hypothetical protein
MMWRYSYVNRFSATFFMEFHYGLFSLLFLKPYPGACWGPLCGQRCERRKPSASGRACAQRRIAPQRDLQQVCARSFRPIGQTTSSVSTWVLAVPLLLL